MVPIKFRVSKQTLFIILGICSFLSLSCVAFVMVQRMFNEQVNNQERIKTLEAALNKAIANVTENMQALTKAQANNKGSNEEEINRLKKELDKALKDVAQQKQALEETRKNVVTQQTIAKNEPQQTYFHQPATNNTNSSLAETSTPQQQENSPVDPKGLAEEIRQLVNDRKMFNELDHDHSLANQQNLAVNSSPTQEENAQKNKANNAADVYYQQPKKQIVRFENPVAQAQNIKEKLAQDNEKVLKIKKGSNFDAITNQCIESIKQDLLGGISH